jgi:hypothetical protein
MESNGNPESAIEPKHETTVVETQEVQQSENIKSQEEVHDPLVKPEGKLAQIFWVIVYVSQYII